MDLSTLRLGPTRWLLEPRQQLAGTLLAAKKIDFRHNCDAYLRLGERSSELQGTAACTRT
jgi:hypothetical protein